MAEASRKDRIVGGVRQDLAHDSAVKQVTGRAYYIDDLPEPPDLLHIQVGMSEKAHARVVGMDLSAVRESPGVGRFPTSPTRNPRHGAPSFSRPPTRAGLRIMMHG